MSRLSPSTHSTTARTWTARLADGRSIQFSAPVEQLADRLAAEARAEGTQVLGVSTMFPPVGWPRLHGEIVRRLAGAHVMTIPDARDDRARAAA